MDKMLHNEFRRFASIEAFEKYLEEAGQPVIKTTPRNTEEFQSMMYQTKDTIRFGDNNIYHLFFTRNSVDVACYSEFMIRKFNEFVHQ